MTEEPEQMLPEERVTAAGNLQRLSPNHKAAREEEARAGEPVHELQDSGALERRERQQQEEGGHKL
jgi:hypothetical protein